MPNIVRNSIWGGFHAEYAFVNISPFIWWFPIALLFASSTVEMSGPNKARRVLSSIHWLHSLLGLFIFGGRTLLSKHLAIPYDAFADLFMITDFEQITDNQAWQHWIKEQVLMSMRQSLSIYVNPDYLSGPYFVWTHLPSYKTSSNRGRSMRTSPGLTTVLFLRYSTLDKGPASDSSLAFVTRFHPWASTHSLFLHLPLKAELMISTSATWFP